MKPHTLRELVGVAGRATDTQILRLVGMVDALPQRGPADEILEALRPRLRQISPPRPLGAERLLFMPMDPIIVSPRDWRPGQPKIPRTAIVPLIAALEEPLRGPLSQARTALAGHNTNDLPLVTRWGEQLWREAAERLPPQPPSEWMANGLPADTFPAIAAMVRVVWRHGRAIWRLRLAGAEGPPEDLVRPVLQAVAAHGIEETELVLSTVIPFASRPSQLIGVATSLSEPSAAAAGRALDRFLDEARPEALEANPAEAPQALGRFAVLLDDFASCTSSSRPARQRRLAELRAATCDACLRHLRGQAGSSFAEDLHQLAMKPVVSDDEVEALEAKANDLKTLGDAARRLSRGPMAEAATRPVLVALAQLAAAKPGSGTGLCSTDILRLIEILGGSAAAAQFSLR